MFNNRISERVRTTDTADELAAARKRDVHVVPPPPTSRSRHETGRRH
jgi:hypothetical protein